MTQQFFAIPSVLLPGLAYQVETGGTPVKVVREGLGGAIITNPYLAIDQGISIAEPLYVNPIDENMTPLRANRKIIALAPGESWHMYPSQINPTTVCSITSGHLFSIVVWFFEPPIPPLPGEGILNFSFPNDSCWWAPLGL